MHTEASQTYKITTFSCLIEWALAVTVFAKIYILDVGLVSACDSDNNGENKGQTLKT